MANLFESYVLEFLGMMDTRLIGPRAGLLPDGRHRFLAMLPNEKVGWMLRARAPLRLAIGVRGNPDLIPSTFHPDVDQPVVLFLTDDLLRRFPEALRRYPLAPPPKAVESLPGPAVMKLLHTVMSLGEEHQLAAYLPPSAPPKP